MSKAIYPQTDRAIYTKGNWFWKGEERFLIKGISYIPCKHGGTPYGIDSRIDPFDGARIDDLRGDIEVFKELGLNTIQISALGSDKSYGEAMQLLADAGIYVLVTLLEEFQPKDGGTFGSSTIRNNTDTASFYTVDLLKTALRIVDEMIKYPNLLGFVVGADIIVTNATTRWSEVYRAAVRDVKAYLRHGGKRCAPVGVSVNDVAMFKRSMLEYITAGDRTERADFFAMDCWGWAYKSSFQISGWKSMVEAYGKYPVPMYLSAFGPHVGKQRLWEEIGCLFSPDMTGVFSGGCLYTYFEYGIRYGIVKPTASGVDRKEEFARLKNQFDAVNQRDRNELYTAKPKDYEAWVGNFPELDERWWATNTPPQVQGGWGSLVQDIEDEREWQFIDRELPDEDDEQDGKIGVVDQLAGQISGLRLTKHN